MTTNILSAIENTRNAINEAKADFVGRTWDCAADELESSLRRGKIFDGTFNNGMSCIRGGNQKMRQRWEALVEEVNGADFGGDVPTAFMDEVWFFIEAENKLVEESAEKAADYGDVALEFLRECEMWMQAGNLMQARIKAAQAEGELEKAAREENEWGDDPAWGPAVKACGELRAAIKDAEDAEAEVFDIEVA
jgi:hypothetical protein